VLNTCQEKFEDTKGIIRRSKSKKDRQYNGVKKTMTKGETMIYKTLHRKDLSNTNPTKNS
jgi:hypothetical protein